MELEDLDLPIKNDEQYQKALAEIKLLETNINICYNDLPNYTNEEDIANIQDYINTCKRRKTAIFTICYLYNAFNKKAEIINLHTVGYRDTLLNIAKTYYGNEGYWKHIYYENELTDIQLTLGQKIKLPFIDDNESLNFLDAFITQLDYINYQNGIK